MQNETKIIIRNAAILSAIFLSSQMIVGGFPPDPKMVYTTAWAVVLVFFIELAARFGISNGRGNIKLNGLLTF